MAKRKIKASPEKVTERPSRMAAVLRDADAATTPSTANGLRAMAMTFVAPEARAVSIVGDFNDWLVSRHPLEMTDGQNWHITLQLAPGTYQYKFFIDGARWEEDPQNPKRVVNEFGTSNSVLEVQ
jgi:1,4-alpha-glucan branching enzyme